MDDHFRMPEIALYAAQSESSSRAVQMALKVRENVENKLKFAGSLPTSIVDPLLLTLGSYQQCGIFL